MTTQQEFLVDEVIEIMSSISVEDFKSALKTMYDDFDYFGKTPGDIAIMFVRGIKSSKVIEFSDFMRAFTSVSSKQR
jgi:hypothetical protein